MLLLRAVLLAVLGFGVFACANVEKVIFTAQTETITSLQLPSSVKLDLLSHNLSSIRKNLTVAFSSTSAPAGLQSWYLLDGLLPGRRYEIRVCWAATQPTAFSLAVHRLDDVIKSVSHLRQLIAFSDSQRKDHEATTGDGKLTPQPNINSNFGRSRMLLETFAAADYFTTNKTLMSSPRPVLVDIILDPYFLNILPLSLLPTAAYILLVAVGSWYLSNYIWIWLHDLSQEPDEAAEDISKTRLNSKPHID